MTAPAQPPASAEMRKLAELAAEPYKLLSHGRLRRACNDGSLHGHQRPGRSHWEVAESVALAWKAGALPSEQKRICPMCQHLATVPNQRGHLRAVNGGAK